MVHLREEFVRLASQEGANVSELCRRFEISRKTGYKWLGRWVSEGLAGLEDQPVRPLNSPGKTPSAIEAKVLEVRQAHPVWGARKITHVLGRDHGLALASSTVNTILKRHGCITAQASQAATAWHRFEHEAPNDLWQMDFKGHFAVGAARCHPLTVLDDHSRFNLVLEAATGESLGEVQPRLQRAFERYGLPRRINTDNGPPWMASGVADPAGRGAVEQQARASADQRQGRTLPPHLEGRGAGQSAIQRLQRGAAALRRLAAHLQRRASASGAVDADARAALSAQPAVDAEDLADHRIRA
jgi:transposase